MRSSANITIYRPGSPNATTVMDVPITAASRRRWKLMEEDSITLSFNLADSIDFRIGDYIDDEVFGHFVISEDPVPADYDPAPGAYKYTLRFDADWINWKNKVFMLPYSGVRKETTWVLTDCLENHLAVILQNLTALQYTGYSVAEISADDIPDKNRGVCLTYSGTSIFDALKALADAYKCEFWVVDKVIHFGKCETGTERIPLSMNTGPDEDEDDLEINVENMVPTRGNTNYGNRFYAYGSTKNIPETYRKHLTFYADTVDSTGTYPKFKDGLRPIYPDMLTPRLVTNPNPTTSSVSVKWDLVDYNQDRDRVFCSSDIPVSGGSEVSVVTPTEIDGCSICYQGQSGVVKITLDITIQSHSWNIPSGVDVIWVECLYQRPGDETFPQIQYTDNTTKGYYATISWRYNGNPRTDYVKLVDGAFVFVDAIPETNAGIYQSFPIGFSAGMNYTLSEGSTDGLIVTKVPVSYYTDDDDTPQNYRTLGERRLMLPRSPYSQDFTQHHADVVQHISNGYVQRDNSLSRDEIVERVVNFEEIYPRCALRVTQVDVSEYANDTNYSDGSKKVDSLPAYTIQAVRVVKNGTDQPFPFDPDTMLGTEGLTATFLTPDEAKEYSGVNENACTLMGMTFGVYCTRSNGVTTYQLAWNTDYGDKLPNSLLRPNPGDCFILAGWNPAAMQSLGLIEAAEEELAITADKYAEFLEEPQFTFDCTMMSDWVEDRAIGISATDKYKKLFLPGQKVKVYHGALSSPMETRVIAYEYKLDIPYDSPILTVGETEAYSKLREIEKSLNAQSGTASAANGVTSTNISGGGGPSSGGGAGKTLHLVPGTMTGMSSVDYDGSEEKTFRVPSSVDHLIDGDAIPRIVTDSEGESKLVDKDGNEVAGKQFFELVQDTQDPTKYSVKLKDEYTGLWASGWLAAGGVGTGGGGGGGGLITSVKGVADLGTPIVTESLTETFSSKAIESIYEAVVALQQSTPNVSLTNGSTYSTLAVNGVSADFYTKAQVDSALANIDLSDYVTNTALNTTLASYATKAELAQVNTLDDISTEQDGFLTFEWKNGDTINVDLNHTHSNYVTVTTTINGVDLSTNRMFYVGKTAIQGVSQSQALQGILSVKETSASSLFEWEASTGAWRFHGNLYADGWVAAGGIGTGGGGGGGGVSSFYDLPEIGISSSSTILAGQVLTYNGTAWVNDNLGVSVSNTIPDGTTGYTRVATITINGVSVNINAPADGGGGGGGGGTETDPIFCASAAYGITSNDITAWNGKLSGVMMNGSTITPTSGVVNLGTVLTAVPDLSGTYVTLTGTQTISGAKTFSSNLSLNAELNVNSISTIIQDTTNHSALFNYGGRTSQAFNAYGTVINLRAFNASEQANILSVQTDRITVGSQLIPNYTTGLNLGGGSSNQRWSTIYGVNTNLTGNLVMSSASYIDIGPVRIVYDSVSKAIHITKADSNDNNEYGLYCEGFIASGGVQATS